MDEATALDEATRRYRRTKKAHDDARKTASAALVDALRAGMPPTEATERSPFSAAYVRRIARENGIEPARPGPKPSAP
jgi:hypothetical protein